MLPINIPQDEFYKFVTDQRNGLAVVFATTEMLRTRGQVDPLWYCEAGDERSLHALIRWIGVRRARWQEWGRLAETVGAQPFHQHMRDLMTAEPLAECTGTVVQRQDDPQEIVMGEMMQGAKGVYIEELYRHRFPSSAARDAFYNWFFNDRNCDLAASLLQIGYSAGTAELGRTLDEIAAENTKPLSCAERRRGRKATAKAV